jgi:hypothetical protein
MSCKTCGCDLLSQKDVMTPIGIRVPAYVCYVCESIVLDEKLASSEQERVAIRTYARDRKLGRASRT